MDIEELNKRFRKMLADDDGSMPAPLRESIKRTLGEPSPDEPQTIFGFPVVVAETCPVCHRFLKEGEIHGHG